MSGKLAIFGWDNCFKMRASKYFQPPNEGAEEGRGTELYGPSVFTHI